VILATHSEMILHALAERLIIFEGGKPWLFEGTYGDFLERVGWQDEQTECSDAGRVVDRADKKWQRAEKKELKRLRAAIIAERSAALSPLSQRISRLEKAIIEIEKRIEADSLTLVRATQAGQGKTIAALSISIHEARKRIDEVFGDLEAASKEHLAKAREFEARLKAVGAADVDDGPGARAVQN
jgi:ATP-binding cassette subfamily F protein 3